MRCKLSLSQIEKYTAEVWPVWECPILKQKALEKERAVAATMTTLMVQAVLNCDVANFESAANALRELMDE